MSEKQKGLIIILLSYLISFSLGLLSYVIMEDYISFKESFSYNLTILLRIFIANVISTIVNGLLVYYLILHLYMMPIGQFKHLLYLFAFL